MIEHARVIAVTVTTALTLALTGCITTTEPTPTPEPTTPPPASPTPSPTPTPALTAEQQNAAAAVKKFYEVINQVMSNDEIDINVVYEVAGGEAAQVWLRDIQALKVAGLRQVGTANPEIRAVDGLATPFVVSACVDTSESDIVDKSGASVVGPGSPTRILYNYTVESVGLSLRVVKGEAVSPQC